MRDTTTDAMKGLAVLFMIQVHILQLFGAPELRETLLGAVLMFLGGAPVAPLFAAAIGYFAAKTHKTSTQLVQSGFQLLALGILLNIGLNARLLAGIASGALALDPWRYIFGVDILLFAGLAKLCLAALRPVLRAHALMYGAAALGVAALSPELIKHAVADGPWVYVNAFFFGEYAWSYFPLFPWLAYPLAGYSCALGLKALAPLHLNKSQLLGLGVGAASVLFGALPYVNASVFIQSKALYHHGVLCFLWICLFLLLWRGVLGLLAEDFSDTAPFNVLKWLGANVTAMYVLQWLLIGNLATTLFQTQSFAQMLVWFLLLAPASMLGAYLWGKIRHELTVLLQKEIHIVHVGKTTRKKVA